MYFYATVRKELVVTCIVDTNSEEEARDILTGQKKGKISLVRDSESVDDTLEILNIISKDEFEKINTNERICIDYLGRHPYEDTYKNRLRIDAEVEILESEIERLKEEKITLKTELKSLDFANKKLASKAVSTE